jgi:hypothetical protein
MNESRLHNMGSGIVKTEDHIAKQAAVFIKLRMMQVAFRKMEDYK